MHQSQEITGCTSHGHLSMHLTIAGWRASLGIPLELRSPESFPCEVRVPGGRISVKRQAVSGKMECARLILAYPVGKPGALDVMRDDACFDGACARAPIADVVPLGQGSFLVARAERVIAGEVGHVGTHELADIWPFAS